MTRRLLRSGFSVLLVGALMVPVVGGPTLAADADESDTSVVDRVKGKKQKIARTDIGNWLRVTDGAGDIVTADGHAIPDAQGFGDIARVSLSKGKTTNKLTKIWPKDHPFGTADSYQGQDSRLKKRQDVIYLVIETDGVPPRAEDPSVQVFVGFDGSEAQPVIPGTAIAPTGGLEQFSQSGVFKGGTFASGTTFLGDTAPGETFDLYTGDSLDIGYLDRKKQAWFHVAYPPEDAERITVAIKSDQNGVTGYDYLVLPTGEKFLDIDDDSFGFPMGETPLLCRDVRTVQADSIDLEALGGATDGQLDGQLLELTAGFTDSFDVTILDGQTAQIELEPFDVEAAATLLEEAGWDVSPAMNSATLRVPIPEGTDRWRATGEFVPSGDAGIDEELAGSLIDIEAAIGQGGFLVGPNLVGDLGGNRVCGRGVVETPSVTS